MAGITWDQLVGLITQRGQASGLTTDQIRAAIAVARSEAGWTGAAGDNGTSFGPFQFHLGGVLDSFAASVGLSTGAAGQYVTTPAGMSAAVDYALSPGGYLYNAIKAGSAAGMQAADLAEYASRYGQRAATPRNAFNAWESLFGGQPAGNPPGGTITVGPIAVPNPVSAVTAPVQGVSDSLGGIASSIAGIGQAVSQAVNNEVAFVNWLAQPGLWGRLAVGFVGVLLLLVGLVLFALSFAPRQVQQMVPVAGQVARLAA